MSFILRTLKRLENSNATIFELIAGLAAVFLVTTAIIGGVARFLVSLG